MYLSVYPDKKKPGRTTVYRVFFGGKRGIRTLGGFQAHTRFPVVRLRPAQPSFHMEVLTRFELVNKGFADLRLTTWPQHRKWSGLRGSNSLPPPWQGGALPDELKPQIYCSVIISYTALNCKCFLDFFIFLLFSQFVCLSTLLKQHKSLPKRYSQIYFAWHPLPVTQAEVYSLMGQPNR